MSESEEDWDKANPWILNKMIKLSERMLDSHESANILIIVCILLAALLAFSIGVTLTRATDPSNLIEINNN